jgi:hypothetical protein
MFLEFQKLLEELSDGILKELKPVAQKEQRFALNY